MCYNIALVVYVLVLLLQGRRGSQLLHQGPNPHPPALEGGVPTTGPPGKSNGLFLGVEFILLTLLTLKIQQVDVTCETVCITNLHRYSFLLFFFQL